MRHPAIVTVATAKSKENTILSLVVSGEMQWVILTWLIQEPGGLGSSLALAVSFSLANHQLVFISCLVPNGAGPGAVSSLLDLKL